MMSFYQLPLAFVDLFLTLHLFECGVGLFFCFSKDSAQFEPQVKGDYRNDDWSTGVAHSYVVSL